VWLDPGGRGSLEVGNGQTLGNLNFRAGAAIFYTYGNLNAFKNPGEQLVLRDRLGVQIFGALGVFDWLEFGLNVPVIAYQATSSSYGLDANAGLGNPWVHAKVMVLGTSKPVTLGIDLGVGIPIGTQSAQGNGGFEFAPKVQLGHVFSEWQIAGELGFLYQPVTDYSVLTGNANDKVGSQLWLGATATTVSATGPRGEVTVRGTAPISGGRAALEAQLGVRFPLGNFELFASAGPGFGGEPGTPNARVYFGGAFANTPLTQPACVEGRPYDLASCPDLDKDGDGIKNSLDKCPNEPEDKDGFEDEDGCPDLDNDTDGVPDAQDKCPLVKGPAANHGCPDVDTDGDGIVDRLDKCPNEPEDKDGFEDEDGCPDLDNDKDGVPDAQDACPNEPGLARDHGCPPKDTDGDGVTDSLDNCPNEKGPAENAGCPVAQKQLVVITDAKLKILDKVYFDLGKNSIQKRSFALLDNVGKVLVSHPEIGLIQVEGHTDNQGNPAANKKLSQERAEQVKTYLVKKGVADTRLRAVGLGDEKPAEPNTTPAGRDANRRVEFNLVTQ
jgi:outer membrane protein OmpA-like peptidoglycan-associated protein